MGVVNISDEALKLGLDTGKPLEKMRMLTVLHSLETEPLHPI